VLRVPVVLTRIYISSNFIWLLSNADNDVCRIIARFISFSFLLRTRAYGRRVQPVHRSRARRAKKGAVNLRKAHSLSCKRFVFIFSSSFFLGVFSTILVYHTLEK
jgi:hypothetical protein